MDRVAWTPRWKSHTGGKCPDFVRLQIGDFDRHEISGKRKQIHKSIRTREKKKAIIVALDWMNPPWLMDLQKWISHDWLHHWSTVSRSSDSKSPKNHQKLARLRDLILITIHPLQFSSIYPIPSTGDTRMADACQKCLNRCESERKCIALLNPFPFLFFFKANIPKHQTVFEVWPVLCKWYNDREIFSLTLILLTFLDVYKCCCRKVCWSGIAERTRWPTIKPESIAAAAVVVDVTTWLLVVWLL